MSPNEQTEKALFELTGLTREDLYHAVGANYVRPELPPLPNPEQFAPQPVQFPTQVHVSEPVGTSGHGFVGDVEQLPEQMPMPPNATTTPPVLVVTTGIENGVVSTCNFYSDADPVPL